MKATDILFCIFNYHQAANSEYLYNELRPTFECHILDADSGERPAPCGGDTVYLPDVHYGGLLHHAVTMAEKGNFPYLFFICSDVIITHETIEQLKHILLSESFEGVGVYCPSHADDSYTWVAWSYSRHSGKRREVAFIEGMISMYSREVYKQVEPLDANPHGWGPDLVACFYERHWGMKCEIDDGISISHPKGHVYRNTQARNEARAYMMSYPEGLAIRWYWILSSIRNAAIQLFILHASYRKWLKIFLPVYRFFHRH